MKRAQATASGAIAAATASAMIFTAAPAAFARDTPTQAERTAGLIEQITGTTDLAASRPAGDAAAKSVTRFDGVDVTVEVPKEASGRIEATGPDGATLGLGLPQTRNVTGTKAGAGTVVYPDAAKATDIAVQPTDDGGARALLALNDPTAPTEHRYDLDLPEGAELVENEEGGYEIVTEVEDGIAVAAGEIESPWAVDANGTPVPTRYELDGTTLVQTVETRVDTAFPVVADPKFKWGIVSGKVYFNRSETKKIRDWSNKVAGASNWCSIVGTGAGIWKKVAKAAGHVGGMCTVVNVIYSNANKIAANAYKKGGCVKVKISPSVRITKATPEYQKRGAFNCK